MEDAAGGLLPLSSIRDIVSTPYFRERLNGRYISTMADLRVPHLETLAKITGGGPIWKPPSHWSGAVPPRRGNG